MSSQTVGDAARSQGNVMRRLEDLEDSVHELQTARRLEAASVGQGGLRVHSGGSVQISGGGGVNITDGGSVTVNSTGAIRALYEDGSIAVMWGRIVFVDGSGVIGHGILIQDDTGGNGEDIFRAIRRPDGQRVVWIGEVNGSIPDDAVPVAEFACEAELVRIRSYGDVAGGTRLDAFDDGNVDLYAQDAGYVWLSSDDLEVHVAYQSTGSAANCHLDVDGQIFRVSSSRKYKRDIRDAEVDVATVLKLRPRTWLPTDEVVGGGLSPNRGERSAPPSEQTRTRVKIPKDTSRQVGFIAEELEDLGLTDFVEHTPDGQPDGIRYDRLSAALVVLCQNQQQQIDDLTVKVTDLTTRVAALEQHPSFQRSSSSPQS